MQRVYVAVGLAVGAWLSLLLVGQQVAYADGSYANLGTTAAGSAGSDAISWSTGNPLTIDAYGHYIGFTESNGGGYYLAYSNDHGATWADSAVSGVAVRPSAAYDSAHDALLVVQASSSGTYFRRYYIARDTEYRITGFYVDPDFSQMVLDDNSSGACTSFISDFPVALYSSSGGSRVVAFWSVQKTCGGTTFTENRASMRILSNDSQDGVQGNWLPLNGVSDAGGSAGPAPVGYNALYSYAGAAATPSGVYQEAAFIPTAGSHVGDIYFFNVDQSITNGFRRLGWNSGSVNWSGTWTSRTQFGGDMNNSQGYSRKDELLSKPVYNSHDGKVYIGIAKWLDNTNGDTQSLFAVASDDTAALAGNVYSAGGAAWFAPTFDIAYNQDDQKIYYFFEASSKDPNSATTDPSFDGHVYYKTYDGSAWSGTATPFFTLSSFSVDIPIVYQSAYNNQLLLLFRVDGAETPYVPPHKIDFGTIPSGGTSVATQSISSPFSQTSFTDFDKQCAAYSSVQVQNTSGGEVGPASVFRDDFETHRGPSTGIFRSLWTPGVWSGGAFNPTPNGMVDVYNAAGGAYLLGNNAYTTQSIEFRAKFVSGANYQHIGYTDGTNFGYYIMFSTNSNGQLNARVNAGGGETQTTLGTTYLDGYHNFKILWDAAFETFYVDGVSVATINVPVGVALYPIISNNATIANADLNVDWLQVMSYATSGTYQSCVLDSSINNASWGNLNYTASLPGSTSVSVQTRTSNDAQNWTGWSSVASGDPASSLHARYIQYQVVFTGTSGNQPTLNDLSLTFAAPTYSITGTVYVDVNGNGVQDAGENGYGGALLTLSTGANATSQMDGSYAFSSLAAGSYTLELTLPNGYVGTTSTNSSVLLNADTTDNFGIAVAPSPTPSVSPSPTPVPLALTVASGKVFLTDRPTLTGTSAPGQQVKVTVFSSPQSGVVTADSLGNWSYTPPLALAVGQHSYEAQLVYEDGTVGPVVGPVEFQVLGAVTRLPNTGMGVLFAGIACWIVALGLLIRRFLLR